MSGFALAVLIDAIPVVDAMPIPMAHGYNWAHHEFTIHNLDKSCRGKEAGMWHIDSKDKGHYAKSLAVADLRKELKSWTRISAGTYYAGALLLNSHLTKKICEFFPATFSGPLSRFGFFHDAFEAFFSVKQDSVVSSFVDAGNWKVEGPLMVVHVRKPKWNLKKHLACVSQVLEGRKLKRARIFVATTASVVQESFIKFFAIDANGFGKSPINLPPGKFQFSFSVATQEKGAGRVYDRKSPSGAIDFKILSEADILQIEGRSTFANAAHAIGINKGLYVVVGDEKDPPRCQKLDYRDPCFHSWHEVRRKLSVPDYLFPYYEKYCDDLAANIGHLPRRLKSGSFASRRRRRKFSLPSAHLGRTQWV